MPTTDQDLGALGAVVDAFGPVLLAHGLVWLLLVVCGVPAVVALVWMVGLLLVAGVPMGAVWLWVDRREQP